jgi:mRNA interferase MazF
MLLLEMVLMNINRGAVWWINLDPTIGSEIKKQRPCVIVSHSSINQVRRTVIIVPLSNSPRDYPPIAIKIKCQNKHVIAVCDQVRTVDNGRGVAKNDLHKIPATL